MPVAPDVADYLFSENNLTITINAQSNIHSYEVQLNMDNGYPPIIKTVIASGAAQLSVDFSWNPSAQQPTDFIVYGYERNLGEYLNTTISIKPQAYQPQTFYVEGGYGVVGAVNFTEAVTLVEQ